MDLLFETSIGREYSGGAAAALAAAAAARRASGIQGQPLFMAGRVWSATREGQWTVWALGCAPSPRGSCVRVTCGVDPVFQVRPRAHLAVSAVPTLPS